MLIRSQDWYVLDLDLDPGYDYTLIFLQTNPRIGTARYDVKKAAAAAVAGYYGLNVKTTPEDIGALIRDDTYIYRRNAEVCRSLRLASLTNSTFLVSILERQNSKQSPLSPCDYGFYHERAILWGFDIHWCSSS